MRLDGVEMQILWDLVKEWHDELEGEHDALAMNVELREINGKEVDEDEYQNIAELAEQLEVADKLLKKLKY